MRAWVGGCALVVASGMAVAIPIKKKYSFTHASCHFFFKIDLTPVLCPKKGFMNHSCRESIDITIQWVQLLATATKISILPLYVR